MISVARHARVLVGLGHQLLAHVEVGPALDLLVHGVDHVDPGEQDPELGELALNLHCRAVHRAGEAQEGTVVNEPSAFSQPKLIVEACMLGGPGGGVGGVRLAGLVYRVPGEGEMRACARATGENLRSPLCVVENS